MSAPKRLIDSKALVSIKLFTLNSIIVMEKWDKNPKIGIKSKNYLKSITLREFEILDID